MRLEHRPERRLLRILRLAAVREPGAEERDRDGPRAAEGRLAVDEVRHASHRAERPGRGLAPAAEGGEEREGRGRGGGGRRGRRGGGAAGAGARGGAVGAEGTETVLEAGRADSGPATLGRVFWTFPDLFFVRVERHFTVLKDLAVELNISL